MSGLPPPPPPNANQPQPDATEALRAALAAAQQAAGGQPNAFLRPAIGAADPQVGVAAAPPRMELVLRNENLGGLGGIYQPQRPLGFDVLELMANAQIHQARIMQSTIEAMTQRFLEASAAQEERLNTHVERIVAAFTAPAITSPSAAAPAHSAQDAGIVVAHHVAAPEVAAQHVAAPQVDAAIMAPPAVVAPFNAAAPVAAAPAVVRRRNSREPVGDARPPLTRKRAAEANHGGR
ncbi:hypothetical protein CAEBREN_02652 [Caenorhabditis brenneri]|uniref:Uncharacterized protein n=1 Tax=Caenorhabditis brenneri TaxID=135651 RepID=G0MMH3_CAEBE|nr:hypothetical protein CAEBREN_02652 [Caenorhabditis brenneri]